MQYDTSVCIRIGLALTKQFCSVHLEHTDLSLSVEWRTLLLLYLIMRVNVRTKTHVRGFETAAPSDVSTYPLWTFEGSTGMERMPQYQKHDWSTYVAALTGVSCSIAFQYYRPQPLWIPVCWNAIFLAINAGMVGLLLKDENDARQQDQDSAALYDRVRTTFIIVFYSSTMPFFNLPPRRLSAAKMP